MIHRILLQRASICLADNRYQNQIPISNNRFLQSYRSARPWKRPMGEQFPTSIWKLIFQLLALIAITGMVQNLNTCTLHCDINLKKLTKVCSNLIRALHHFVLISFLFIVNPRSESHILAKNKRKNSRPIVNFVDFVQIDRAGNLTSSHTVGNTVDISYFVDYFHYNHSHNHISEFVKRWKTVVIYIIRRRTDKNRSFQPKIRQNGVRSAQLTNKNVSIS